MRPPSGQCETNKTTLALLFFSRRSNLSLSPLQISNINIVAHCRLSPKLIPPQTPRCISHDSSTRENLRQPMQCMQCINHSFPAPVYAFPLLLSFQTQWMLGIKLDQSKHDPFDNPTNPQRTYTHWNSTLLSPIFFFHPFRSFSSNWYDRNLRLGRPVTHLLTLTQLHADPRWKSEPHIPYLLSTGWLNVEPPGFYALLVRFILTAGNSSGTFSIARFVFASRSGSPSRLSSLSFNTPILHPRREKKSKVEVRWRCLINRGCWMGRKGRGDVPRLLKRVFTLQWIYI